MNTHRATAPYLKTRDERQAADRERREADQAARRSRARTPEEAALRTAQAAALGLLGLRAADLGATSSQLAHRADGCRSACTRAGYRPGIAQVALNQHSRLIAVGTSSGET